MKLDVDKVSEQTQTKWQTCALAISHLETIGDLKSFLGACVYLIRFIKDYAMITSPLYALAASQKTKTNKIRHT